jgi:hypothetical protein
MGIFREASGFTGKAKRRRQSARLQRKGRTLPGGSGLLAFPENGIGPFRLALLQSASFVAPRDSGNRITITPNSSHHVRAGDTVE